MDEQRAAEAPYDVIIVGGRPAGASLAARLGERGRRVLVIDRAELPSAPGVPSCPAIYPPAIRLLEEIGVTARDYAEGAIQIQAFVLEFHTYFAAHMNIPEGQGCSPIYGIDRAPFDLALWKNLARFPSVTARSRFAFDDLIRDDAGRVVGIEGHAEGGEKERFLAGCVVGADGRFSAVARKAGAKITEDRPEHTSTVYFADWEGVLPYDDGPAATVHIYATGRGTDVLHFPLPNGNTTICTHMRSDRVDIRGDADAFYLGVLQSYAGVRRRLVGAKRVTPVIGLKRVANRYLEAGGPGWVLVGDALHHKDPVDGQGIYDALIEAKVLAEALAAVEAGQQSFTEAVAWYEKRVREETHGMFLATMDRLKNELYEEPPVLVMRTLIRWLITDPEYQLRFLRFLSRAIPAEGWLPPALVRSAALRGALGDVRRLVQRVIGPRTPSGQSPGSTGAPSAG